MRALQLLSDLCCHLNPRTRTNTCAWANRHFEGQRSRVLVLLSPRTPRITAAGLHRSLEDTPAAQANRLRISLLTLTFPLGWIVRGEPRRGEGQRSGAQDRRHRAQAAKQVCSCSMPLHALVLRCSPAVATRSVHIWLPHVCMLGERKLGLDALINTGRLQGLSRRHLQGL